MSFTMPNALGTITDMQPLSVVQHASLSTVQLWHAPFMEQQLSTAALAARQVHCRQNLEYRPRQGPL